MVNRINNIRLFLVLLFLGFFSLFLPTVSLAGQLHIFTLSPFPSQVDMGGEYYATYKLTAAPNQTITFKNNFPVGVTQITEGNVCTLDNTMPSSGNCTISLKLIAPQVKGLLNPVIKACIKNTPICISYPLSIRVSTPLSFIEISPNSVALNKGLTQAFIATGTYADNSTANLTSVVNWVSDNTSIANITSGGLATVLADSGIVNITANTGSITNVATITALPKQLSLIEVDPINILLPKGTNQQLTAQGIYTDGTTEDLTTNVTWTVEDSSITTITNTGLITSISSSGVSGISATLLNVTNNSAVLTAAPPVLTSITLNPVNSTIPKGTTQQFFATGAYTDNSTLDITSNVNWSSSNEYIATIIDPNHKGLAYAANVGVANISAYGSGISSNSSLLEVTPATLVAIAITPSNSTLNQGLNTQFIATGIYTDNSTQNFTTTVTWNSDTPSVAVINSTGFVTAIANSGTTNITANLGSLTNVTALTATPAALMEINVTPSSATINNGLIQNFTAIGTYSDGSTQNITSNVAWNSSNTSVASINPNGVAQAVAEGGVSNITASLLNIASNVSVFTAAPAILLSITISPLSISLNKGLSQQFLVNGSYTDSSIRNITSLVTWNSSNLSVAMIDPDGAATVLANFGSSNITASLSEITSNASSITATQRALVSISVEPESVTVNKGMSQQFIANGAYTDSCVQNITSNVLWLSSNNNIVTIANSGLATVVSNQGASDITAEMLGVISNTSNLIAAPAALTSISISPPSTTINKGLTQNFSATGTYSDNSTQNITTTVNWQSSNTSIATINQSGIATVVANSGIVTITANSGAINDTANLTASPVYLTHIAINPPRAVLPFGNLQQYLASGTYTDRSIQNITSSVNWQSSNTSVANITGSGLVTILSNSGLSNITANLSGVTGRSLLTAIPVELVSITITPSSATVNTGESQQFIANGTYSDGSVANITANVDWDSSNEYIATIDDTNNKGVATVIANSGITNISASLQGVTSGKSVLMVELVAINISPQAIAVNSGYNQQFIATGVYADNSTQNITLIVNWNSSNTAVATINSFGIATAAANSGTSNITASLGSVTSDVAILTATPPSLVSIVVLPSVATINQGLTQQFIANGTYSDGSVANITTSVNWTSTNTSVATINIKGLATAVANSGTSDITANLGAVSSNASVLTASPAVLVSISVFPESTTVNQCFVQQFTANGTYSDGSIVNMTGSVNWNSSNTSVATINNTGVATAVANSGTSNITAGNGTIVSDIAVFTAAPLALAYIIITPSNVSLNSGINQQFTAIGVMGDNTTVNITTNATWVSDNQTVATINNTGYAVTTNIGRANIIASLGTVNNSSALLSIPVGLTAIVITSPSVISINNGTNMQLTANGTVNNTTTVRIGSIVNWTSSNTSAITINATGVATAVSNSGSANITANLSGITSNPNVFVAGLYSYSVSWSNGTGWSVNGLDSNIAYSITADRSGRVYVGSTGSNVWKYNGTSWSQIGFNLDGNSVQSLTTDSSNNLYVGTGNDSVGIGNVWKYNGASWSKIGDNLDGSTVYSLTADVFDYIYAGTSSSYVWKYISGTSWTYLGMGPLESGGVVYSLTSDGSGSIYAGTSKSHIWKYTGTWANVSYAGFTDPIMALTTDSSNKVYAGDSRGNVWRYISGSWSAITPSPLDYYSIVGLDTYNNNIYAHTAMQHLYMYNTTNASWINMGSISGSGTAGPVIISSTTATAMPPVLLSIAISPGNATVNKGLTQHFIATGTYTDGSEVNITTSVGWSSNNTSIANISSSGVATAQANSGTVTITAASGAVSNNASLTAAPPIIEVVTITPAVISVNKGLTQQFIATGLFSDNTTVNVTSSVNWTSTNTSVATINSTGVANVLTNSGTTAITATSCNVTSSPIVFTGDGGDGRVYKYNGTTWVMVSNIPETTPSAMATDNSGNVYVATFNSDAWKYNGTAWVRIGTNLDGSLARALTLDNNLNVYVGTSASNVWKYNATTSSWTKIGNNLDGSIVRSLTSDGSNNIYAGTANYNVWKYSSSSWSRVGSGSNLDNGIILALDTDSNNNIYAGTGNNNVWQYNGTSWTKIGNNLDGNDINTLTIDSNNNIYAGTSNKNVWKYNGTSWVVIGSNLDGGTITELATDLNDNIYAGTGSGYVWKYNGTSWTNIDGRVYAYSISALTVASSSTLTAAPAVLSSISISPTNITINKGLTQQFIANGTYADGGVVNITANVNWASSSTSVATINSAGVANVVANSGTTNISANVGAVNSGIAVLTAAPEVLVSITLTPSVIAVNKDSTQKFIANGTYSDNSTKNITLNVEWNSDNTTVATINLTGAATALSNSGISNITANLGAVNSTTAVLTLPLTALAVSPTIVSVGNGSTQQFIATALYSDNTTLNVTSIASWTSSSNSVATIANSGLAAVVASSGSTAINASFANTASGPIIYAGTLGYNIWQYNGINWTEIYANVDGSSGELATDSSGNVYYATGIAHNVWKYNGTNWSTIASDNLDNYTIGAIAAEGNNVYIATRNTTLNIDNVWRYNGTSWTKISNNLDGCSVTSITTDSSNRVYVGTYAPGIGNVWEYTTGWSEIGGNIDAGGIWSVAVPRDGSAVYAASMTVWMYSGGYWTNIGDALSGGSSIKLTIDSSNTLYAALTGGNKVYRYNYNAGTWSNTGGTHGTVYTLSTDVNKNVYSGETGSNVSKYNSTTYTWTKIGVNLDGKSITDLATSKGSMLTATP